MTGVLHGMCYIISLQVVESLCHLKYCQYFSSQPTSGFLESYSEDIVMLVPCNVWLQFVG